MLLVSMLVSTMIIYFIGSEDVTVRIWDIHTRRANKCLLSFFEGGDCVDIIAFRKINGNIVYASCGSNFFTFDTRKEGV